jgi:hypothetical protein
MISGLGGHLICLAKACCEGSQWNGRLGAPASMSAFTPEADIAGYPALYLTRV